MERAMKIFWMSVLGLLILGLTGCGTIEDAIEDMTTRTVTINHVVYDGTPDQDVVIESLMEDMVVHSGETVARPIENLGDFMDSVDCFVSDLNPALVFVTGKITNSTNYGANVLISIGPKGSQDNPDQWTDLGSVFIYPGESLLFTENDGLSETAEQVDSNLYEFFTGHPEIIENPESNGADVFFTVEGDSNARVNVKFFELSANPVYRVELPISGDMIGGYSNRVKSIGAVALNGEVTNKGEKEMRFMLVLSDYGETVNYETGLVADGFIQPGKTAKVADLVVEGGLSRIKTAMYDMIEGDLISGNIYILSDTTVAADVDSLKIESKLTVGL